LSSAFNPSSQQQVPFQAVQQGPQRVQQGQQPVQQAQQPAQAPAQKQPAKASDDLPPIPSPPTVISPTHPLARVLTGTLVVKPQMGKFDKNYDSFGKMDPYAVAYVGTGRQETQVAKGQGQECSWEDALHFPIKGEQFLFIDTLDYDFVGKHDYIGRAQLDLTQLFAQGPHFQNWVPLFDKNQQKVGQVFLTVDMVTEGAVPNMPASYRPHHGPVANILQHSFGDWARLHPGYQPAPVIAPTAPTVGANQHNGQVHHGQIIVPHGPTGTNANVYTQGRRF
jgi:hypothetical protein